ncbi:hypothetical protein ACFFTN_13255 [Aminobacter aganoensis]|uniref:Uncharacterized protein n=1 Tax=Aminobacter aganoensis TaxID=83264 RepID=A0A7X0F9P6_9HYPH|nr:hypothetical protein [Aminobacter aganoensis]MBB6355719.1 hypothetical protein [Aminobacter aganoensis]
MTRIFNPYIALDNIDAIRSKVTIRRDACRTEFARTLHTNLVEKLDAMRADVEKEVPYWIEQNEKRHRSEMEESLFVFYFMRPCFEQRWIDEGPHSVLDEISVTVYADEPGIACGVTLGHTDAPASELEGLDELFAEIRQKIGVNIKAARLIRRR